MVSRRLERRATDNLRPIARAFALAYISSTGPKFISLLVSFARKKRNISQFSTELPHLLLQALKLNQFPTFCAAIVGISNLLYDPFYRSLLSLRSQFRGHESAVRVEYCRLLAKFIASLVAALISFQLFNSQDGKGDLQSEATVDGGIGSPEFRQDNRGRAERVTKIPPEIPPLPAKAMVARPPKIAMGIPLAGKSMDITLFAFTRAVDVLLNSSSASNYPTNRMKRWTSKSATPLVFAASSAILMHAFFYAPSRLPYTYVKWINRLAGLDERLLRALQEARYGNFIYGKDTGIAPLLGSMCKDYGLPEHWGDPAKTIPLPCEVVHHGSGPNCEWHAISRFYRGWKQALGVYVPLQAFILVRALSKRPKNPLLHVQRAVVDAARNSAFLGAFISLFYYGVCLGRTRLGPKLFSSKTISPQMWDGGLCITSGCLFCGWSVLLEIPRRQIELMLFVVPRAVGVWFPRRYDRLHRWREQFAFAVSVGVILAAAQERPERVRGVFGRVLQTVLAP